MKLAIVIAPFLLVGGYIAADYYTEITAEKNNLFKLIPQGTCDIIADRCTLEHGKLSLKISDQGGLTQFESNHALETAAMSIVDDKNQELQYPMKTDREGLIWEARTQLAARSASSPEQKIRIIVTVNKAYYFSELVTSQGEK